MTFKIRQICCLRTPLQKTTVQSFLDILFLVCFCGQIFLFHTLLLYRKSSLNLSPLRHRRKGTCAWQKWQLLLGAFAGWLTTPGKNKKYPEDSYSKLEKPPLHGWVLSQWTLVPQIHWKYQEKWHFTNERGKKNSFWRLQESPLSYFNGSLTVTQCFIIL